MIHHLKNVLTADELRQLRELAQRVRWDDGRGSAGSVAAPPKHNNEAPDDTPEARATSDIGLRALRRHHQFFNAATLTSPLSTPPWIAAPSATASSGLTSLRGSLPAIMSPLMMNRYAEGMDYGDHCDAWATP